MKIKEITISNWRSIKLVSIDFADLMIFIGQNNHGKSNILSAILFFFGENKHQDLDFNYGADELYVEVTFNDLDDNDKVTFKKYLTMESEIKVRKIAFKSGSFEYRGYLQNPVDDWLQEINATAYTQRDTARTFPFYSFLPESGRLLKQNIIDAQLAYINANKEKINFNYELESNAFLGLKSVAKGIFGDIYFIPAIKNISEDLVVKESSAFGKLYAKVIDSMSNNNTAWGNAKKTLSDLFNGLNKIDSEGNINTARPEQLTAFEERLSAELLSWGAEIDVEVVPPNIDDVFKAHTQVWVNDGVKTDINRKGHGLQRALTFALIKIISDTLKLERMQMNTQSARLASSSVYFILEEPELYLHPQAQRALLDSLLELSQAKSQIILCTHSSALIDLDHYKSICIVRKDTDERGTQISQYQGTLFSNDKKKDFNISYWINPDRGELFFAKKVILLEGATDKSVIPFLAKKLGVFKYQYTLVDCGAKTAIPLYIKLLNSFSIPYVVVYDKDHQSFKNQQARNAADIVTTLIINECNNFLGKTLALNNDIEEEIGLTSSNQKNKPYIALEHVSANDFHITPSFEEKIRSIYE